jgi:hypothetical protein
MALGDRSNVKASPRHSGSPPRKGSSSVAELATSLGALPLPCPAGMLNGGRRAPRSGAPTNDNAAAAAAAAAAGEPLLHPSRARASRSGRSLPSRRRTLPRRANVSGRSVSPPARSRVPDGGGDTVFERERERELDGDDSADAATPAGAAATETRANIRLASTCPPPTAAGVAAPAARPGGRAAAARSRLERMKLALGTPKRPPARVGEAEADAPAVDGAAASFDEGHVPAITEPSAQVPQHQVEGAAAAPCIVTNGQTVEEQEEGQEQQQQQQQQQVAEEEEEMQEEVQKGQESHAEEKQGHPGQDEAAAAIQSDDAEVHQVQQREERDGEQKAEAEVEEIEKEQGQEEEEEEQEAGEEEQIDHAKEHEEEQQQQQQEEESQGRECGAVLAAGEDGAAEAEEAQRQLAIEAKAEVDAEAAETQPGFEAEVVPAATAPETAASCTAEGCEEPTGAEVAADTAVADPRTEELPTPAPAPWKLRMSCLHPPSPLQHVRSRSTQNRLPQDRGGEFAPFASVVASLAPPIAQLLTDSVRWWPDMVADSDPPALAPGLSIRSMAVVARRPSAIPRQCVVSCLLCFVCTSSHWPG